MQGAVIAAVVMALWCALLLGASVHIARSSSHS